MVISKSLNGCKAFLQFMIATVQSPYEVTIEPLFKTLTPFKNQSTLLF